jgi:hypothetical protein
MSLTDDQRHALGEPLFYAFGSLVHLAWARDGRGETWCGLPIESGGIVSYRRFGVNPDGRLAECQDCRERYESAKLEILHTEAGR